MVFSLVTVAVLYLPMEPKNRAPARFFGLGSTGVFGYRGGSKMQPFLGEPGNILFFLPVKRISG